MSPQLPHAAKALIREIQEIDDDATFEADNLDGLGVYRALHIYTGDNLGIAEALSRVGGFDRRIAHVDCDDTIVTVTFPPDQIVWTRARFGVKDIYEALSPAPGIVDVPLPDEIPPAKKAAKTSSPRRKKS